MYTVLLFLITKYNKLVSFQKICDIIALVDMASEKVRGEALDLQEAHIFTNCRVIASSGKF